MVGICQVKSAGPFATPTRDTQTTQCGSRYIYVDVACISVCWGGLSAVPSMADKPTSTVIPQVWGTDTSLKY